MPPRAPQQPALRIGSVNLRGLATSGRLRAAAAMWRAARYDIVFIQEHHLLSHLHDRASLQAFNSLGWQVFISFGRPGPSGGRRGGTAVLLRRTLLSSGELVEPDVQRCPRGRYTALSLTWSGHKLHLCSVYLPNCPSKRVRYISSALAPVAAAAAAAGRQLVWVVISTSPLTLLLIAAPSPAPPCAVLHARMMPALSPVSPSTCPAWLMSGAYATPHAEPSPSPTALCLPALTAYMCLSPFFPVPPAPPLGVPRWLITALSPSLCLASSPLLLAASVAACGLASSPLLPLFNACRVGLLSRPHLMIPTPWSVSGGLASSAASPPCVVSCSVLLLALLLKLRRRWLHFILLLAGGRQGMMLPCLIWLMPMAGGVLLLIRRRLRRRRSCAVMPGYMWGSGPARL